MVASVSAWAVGQRTEPETAESAAVNSMVSSTIEFGHRRTRALIAAFAGGTEITQQGYRDNNICHNIRLYDT